MSDELTHIAPDGSAKMVDVSSKQDTRRTATARGAITMKPETRVAILANTLKKGDVISTARLAGIMGAKRTSDLVPLCHPLPLHDVQITIEPHPESETQLVVEATAVTVAKTGVEMEALTACSVALLTLYDMAKAVDRHMEIGGIKVVAKAGGRSGDWSVDEPEAASEAKL